MKTSYWWENLSGWFVMQKLEFSQVHGSILGFTRLVGYTCETRSWLEIELVRKPIMDIGPRCRKEILSCSMI